MVTDTRLERIEKLLIELRDLTKIAVELHHEWLDRPPPKSHVVVDISAWGIAQLRRLADAVVYAAKKVSRQESGPHDPL